MPLLSNSADQVVEFSGNGSSTKARLDPPFCIFPPLRPQLDVRYDVASEGDMVDVGAISVVLVVSPYIDANAAGEMIEEDAAVATSLSKSSNAIIVVRRTGNGQGISAKQDGCASGSLAKRGVHERAVHL